MIEIVLAGPPMGKQRVRATKTGHIYTPEKTVNYENALRYAAQLAMQDRPLFDGPLLVSIEARMQVPESKPKKWRADALAGRIRPTKKPDFDNIAKMIDAMNLVVWTDDAQIVDGRVTKIYHEKPALVVRVVALEEGMFG